jgi:hypothetical protein
LNLLLDEEIEDETTDILTANTADAEDDQQEWNAIRGKEAAGTTKEASEGSEKRAHEVTV